MNAQKVSSTVAVPLSTMIDVTVRLSVSVVPRSSVNDVAEVLDVLLEDRLVEARGVLALGELLLRQPAAERRLDRVARGHPHQQEDHRQQDEDGRDRERQARQRVAPQRGAVAHERPERYPEKRATSNETRAEAEAPARVYVPIRFLVLRNQPEAEDEGRVEGVLDPVDPVANRRDLVAFPDRDVRRFLRRDLLDLRRTPPGASRRRSTPSRSPAASESPGCRSGCSGSWCST